MTKKAKQSFVSAGSEVGFAGQLVEPRSFVVAGVSAYHLWRGQCIALARKAFSLALCAALVLALLQVVVGDAPDRAAAKVGSMMFVSSFAA